MTHTRLLKKVSFVIQLCGITAMGVEMEFGSGIRA